MVGLWAVLWWLWAVAVIRGQSQDPNQFDQILRDLDLLTRQQLQAQANVDADKSTTTTTTTTSTATPPVIAKKLPTSLMRSSGVDSVDSGSSSSSTDTKESFRLPPKYNPNRLPRFSRIKPMVVTVNITILHVNVDKTENTVNLDVEMIECWRDKRLRTRKSTDKTGDAEDDFSVSEEDEEDPNGGGRVRRGEHTHLLESEWASRVWHPISRLQGNAQVVVATFVPSTVAKPAQSPPTTADASSLVTVKQRTLEHENSIRNLVVVTNETTAHVWLSLKARIKIPMYECARDESSLYPFDKVRCTLSIANVMYDRRNLVYVWQNINWLSNNAYQTGEFYLRDLTNSITSEPLLDLDKDHSEHSTMRLEMLLRRQIGDYVLNVYVLHMFLLALCVATFWISVDNIVIRISLAIIVLIIIKFQTIQTLKDDRHIVSALSVWTFGLSCLVILCLLCHILSYYSVQHKWNDKILNRLVKNRGAQTTNTNTTALHTRGQSGGGVVGSRGVYTINPRRVADYESTSSVTLQTESVPTDSSQSTASPNLSGSNTATHSTLPEVIPIPLPDESVHSKSGGSVAQRWTKVKQNCLVWLNSIILSHSRKDEGYDRINLVDIISRVTLLVVYLLFVLIYFCTYVF